jgi:hypothetical protein
MRKLLKSETLIASSLLLFLGWLGVQATVSNIAIASIQTKQESNEKVHNIVNGLTSFIPKMEEKLLTIERGIAANAEFNNKLATMQRLSNAKVYCLYTYPIPSNTSSDVYENKRDRCIQDFINDGG